jgi:hypothetical protein
MATHRLVAAVAGLVTIVGPERARATSWSFDAGAGLAAAWSSRDGALGGGNLRLGLRWWSPTRQRSGGPDATAILVGDVPGVDLRARILDGAPAGRFGTAFTLGLAAGLATRVGRERSRVPSLLSLFVPEVGLLARSYAPPRAYLGWSAPLAYQAHSWSFLSLELTPTLLVVPSTNDVEYVALLSLSGLGR